MVSFQIYVEIERARLTRQLASIKEAAGEVEEAAEIMQEVAVVCAHPPPTEHNCNVPVTRSPDHIVSPGLLWFRPLVPIPALFLSSRASA